MGQREKALVLTPLALTMKPALSCLLVYGYTLRCLPSSGDIYHALFNTTCSVVRLPMTLKNYIGFYKIRLGLQ